MVTVCKIFRSQGLFLDVRERLELCLLYPGSSNKIQILCSLADVYCDLAEVGGDSISPKARNSLDTVRHLMDLELNKRSTNSKAFRRLKVSQTEMDIQGQRYEDARKNIQEMKGIFSNLFNLDVSDQLLHVRVLIASARVYHIASDFVEAIQEWKVALEYAQKYASFEGEGFTYAAINLSLSLAYLRTGHRSEASISFGRAARLLLLGIQDYWIPTLWAWVEDTLLKIQSISGWKNDWTQRSAGIRRAIEKDYRIASPWLTDNPHFT
jgi:tetratricopeptide (TPR) repeat protein